MADALGAAPPELVARWRADEERQLSVEDFMARVAAPVSEHERDDMRSLIEWFCRRYPSAEQRLAYHRRRELAERRR